MTAAPPTEPFRVTGGVNKVRFRAESGFTVMTARLRNSEGEDPDATVIGVMPPLEAGDTFSAEVLMEEHREYGYQYRVLNMVLEAQPADLTEAGVAAYLEARVGGVGKVLAGRIAKTFGPATFDLLEQEPEKLLQVPGITQSTLHKMVSSWSQQGLERRLLAGLQGLGLSISQAQRAVKHFGEAALERLQADLFALTEVEGIGFLTADKLWSAQGLPHDDPRRLTAAAVYALQQAGQQGGHSFLPRERAERGVVHYTRVSPEQARLAVETAVELGRLSDDPAPDGSARIYLPHVLRAEKKLAQLIRTLLATPPAADEWSVPAGAAKGLSEEQAQVLHLLEDHRLVVLTGGPGTGKSTTTRAVADLAEKLGLEVGLCAPTGKAARRLGEVTGRSASTIHRLLGYGPAGFRHNHLEPAPYDLLIVDEVSMTGDALMLSLLAAVPPGARVLLVGDTDQLPPVDAGLPLLAIAQSAPTVRLSTVYRQAAENPIIRAAHGLLHGQAPQWGDLRLDLTETEPDVGARRVALMVRELGGPTQVQVLTPMRKGPLGVELLNTHLQALFNPGQGGIRIADGEARPGDMVVQTKNDYGNEVFNGTIGTVLKAEGNRLTVDFDGNIVELAGAELFNLQLGYALTVHRAQGSEWPTVLGVLHEAHMPMLSRNLVYTALTRARERFYAVGSASAWAKAAGRQREERNTALLERIRGRPA
ncbi:ATP-dependent RecD-like DNA helicase [Deinococcus metallilatus]|uniref:ATP-dependent RecD2 DNA helicase n=1 Tax=Deinococcus metallilatus TaxID=1211322 RepID=A0AAJ5F2K3_9DEIO|nr:ATP-dependent RecD-like DNA helicase [Deinococcus metallilatus]MBB5295237.1 exodeoxyribonuclease V alpha subunit [Deinococcus metallilatus]QBY08601.1 ATP-dependent RecD-like DNA helicase [Deinococcus metallilatus]RXJ10480.1 ATP-dependent RecD-like DNA helicase [Deinococcus metallilatus]TLK26451.1 ATP-dependent RecD-like DNA helicase [Deinococcus metallilatus]GMA15011.1 ATP-dependent RecD-like DNA helicase [Deinococcus metallilatus]